MPRNAQKPGAPSHRLERVGEQIRHALSEIFSRGEVDDPVLNRRLVTIAAVRMSPDLRLASVYVMPLGGKDAPDVLAASFDLGLQGYSPEQGAAFVNTLQQRVAGLPEVVGVSVTNNVPMGERRIG